MSDKADRVWKAGGNGVYRTWILYLAGLCLLSCVAGILTGCSTDGQKGEVSEAISSDQETVELDFYIWDDEAFCAKRVVEAFNAVNPGIRVTLHEIINDVYDDAVREKILSGEKVDIMGIRGVGKIMDYQRDGLLLEISDYMWKSDLDLTAYGNMIYTYTIDNQYYGLPTRSTCWVLYYNKRLFEEAGMSFPGQLTWEEYARLAKQLTNEKEGKDKIWGGYFVDWVYYFAGVQRQNYLYDDDISDTMEGLLWLNRFYNEDQSHVPFADVLEIRDDYLELFENGTFAMMLQGEWAAGMLRDDEKEGNSKIDWDIAPMPVFEGMEGYTTWGQYQFAGITSGCAHPDEAFAFLQYLCGKEGAAIYAAAGMISAYTDETTEELYRESLKGKNVEVFFRSQRIQEIPSVLEYDDLTAILNETAERYLLGEISYEEAVQTMEERRRALYQGEDSGTVRR